MLICIGTILMVLQVSPKFDNGKLADVNDMVYNSLKA